MRGEVEKMKRTTILGWGGQTDRWTEEKEEEVANCRAVVAWSRGARTRSSKRSKRRDRETRDIVGSGISGI